MAHRTQLTARDAEFLWEISVGARFGRPRENDLYFGS
jgi:hypothetical protein